MASTPRTSTRVAVLGPVLVEGRLGTLIEPSGALGKSLIVALVLARDGGLSPAALIDELWGDQPPRQAKAALQTLVSRVRAECADGLVISAHGGYALAVEPEAIDLGQAGRMRDAARASLSTGDYASSEEQSSAALALWRAEPGTELAEAPSAELSARAATLRSELQRIRVESRLHLGQSAEVIAELEALTAAAPLDEELHLLLMRALANAGRRNDALVVFARVRGALREQLGTSPSAALVGFNAELLQDAAPNAETSSRVRIGLREAPNRLLGREHDVAALQALMRDSRLTTILGPGGLGKTRLAQELAHTASDPAVIFVELASVRVGADVTLAFGSTLGIREATGGTLTANDPSVRLDVRERILATLGERDTLLVVDNCEHVVDAAAAWIADILASTASVRVLATSRSPLAISGESVYPLGSLASGNETSGPGPAAALFSERALAARPGVALPEPIIARLCARLDGLPLAIELAAARVRSMSVEEIERRLNNRFALLTAGERTAPERHRTLMAVIDWSWNLLDDSERALLRRLSRFPDGFSAKAAQLVGIEHDEIEVTDALDGLVNQSLISASEDPATGSMRYRMLETVREFGELALATAGEEQGVRSAMFEWAEIVAARLLPDLNGTDQVATFHRVALEQDNLIAVLRAAIEAHEAKTTLGIFATLGFFWSMRGAHSDVTAFGASILRTTRHYVPELAHLDAPILGYSLVAVSTFTADRRSTLLGLGRLRAIKRLGIPSDSSIEALSTLILASSDLQKVYALVERYRTSSDIRVASIGTLFRSQLAENAGEPGLAMSEAQRAYDLALQLGNIWLAATAAQSLANLYSQRGKAEQALDWAARSERAMGELQASGDLQQLSWLIAMNETALGKTERARTIFTTFTTSDADRLGDDLMDLHSIGWAGLAEIALVDGLDQEALSLYRTASETFTPGANRGAPWFALVTTAAVCLHLAAGASEKVWAERAARRLRTRLLVTERMQTGFVDIPVAGSAVLGVSVWLTSRDQALLSPELIEVGLQLLAIAELLGCRQDLPSLAFSRYADAAVAAHGAAAVEAARASIAGLSPTEAFALACKLLRHPALRAG
ncbi:MAG: BTAD domain-containing putative transcriptional regulator [Lacisediminihabitans sp.]